MNGRLSDLPTFVNNAFRLEPVHPFVPENTVLGQYVYLPWVRTGMAAAIQGPPADGLRGLITVSLPVQGNGASQSVDQQLALRGPGDVLGFSGQQIIRRQPQAGATRVEDSFLAHVEFDRPDFPWLMTPLPPAGGRLAPWIALVVLRAGAAELTPTAGGLPARVQTTLGELQPLGDSWAWAHAQVTGTLAGPGPSVEDRLMPQYAPVNLSRLACPRRLDPDESWLACVVPAFDAGVNTGLGSAQAGTLDPAWRRAPDGSDADSAITLPVYASWNFTTGPDGDFGSLAERLAGMPAPWQVGRRSLDASRPRGGLPDLGAGDSGRLQIVHASLVSPQIPSPASDDPAEVAAARAESATWPGTETDNLRGLLNRPDEIAGRPGALSQDERPLIGPEIYARTQAGESRVDPSRDSDWFGQLNLDPRVRIAAGLGARVVQKDREALMQAAWDQVGEVEAANRELRRAQLARFVGGSLHVRHLSAMRLGDLLQVSRPAHGIVATDAGLTVRGKVDGSATAPAATTAAFRRATRSRGGLARYADGRLGALVADGQTPRDFRRPYQDLDGVAGISTRAASVLPPALVGDVLGLQDPTPDAALGALLSHGQQLAESTPVADALTPQVLASATPAPGTDLARLGAERVLGRLQQALPADPASDPGRSIAAMPGLKALQGLGGTIGDDAGSILQPLVPIVVRPGPLPPGPVPPIVVGPGPFGPVPPPPFHPLPIEPVPIGPGPVPPLPFHPGPVPPVPIRPQPPFRPGPFDPGPFRPPLAREPDEAAIAVQVDPDLRLSQFLGGGEPIPPSDSLKDLEPVAADLVGADWPVTPALPALDLGSGSLLAPLSPAVTVTKRILGRLGDLPSWLPPGWFDDGLVSPIMAAPVFTRPMYQALDSYDREWLIPGLATLPTPDLATVLVSNAPFVEAFLAGLSHEMARLLLFRGYPTDQRATYFRRFWDANSDELVQQLHEFSPTPLGTHVLATLAGRLVLLVRGELIRRYPNAILLALRAGGTGPSGHPVFIDPVSDPTATAPLLFHAHLAPDMVLAGFDLTVPQIQSESWWFVIAEHPTAPRFGLEIDSAVGTAWGQLPAVLGSDPEHGFLTAGASSAAAPDWGADAAQNATVLLRDPVRAAFDAAKLLAPTGALS